MNPIQTEVNNIFNEFLNLENPFFERLLANSIELLSSDIYSEHIRFIYELIQNADDASVKGKSTVVKIEVVNDYVIISHKGQSFTTRDIRGLCGIAQGTKEKDSSTTGYKGIGFKSVFGQSDGLVYVKTDDTLFRFDQAYIQQRFQEKKSSKKNKYPWQNIPILSSNTGVDQVDEILNNKAFSVKTAIKLKNGLEFLESIKSLLYKPEFILFLRRISKVEFRYKNKVRKISKVLNAKGSSIITIRVNDEDDSNWYLKGFNLKLSEKIKDKLKVDSSIPKKISKQNTTEVALAFKLNKDASEIIALNKTETRLYSYLPTDVTEFQFPFLVNATFILDAGREKIHKNTSWNEWLLKVIGYKTVECSSIFQQDRLFEKSNLSILDFKVKGTSYGLKSSFDFGFRKGIETFPLVYNRVGVLKRIAEVVLDEYGIHDVDKEITASLRVFYNQKYQSQKQLVESDFIEIDTQTKNLKKYWRNPIDLNKLKEFLQSDCFKRGVSIENNLKLLYFLRELEEKESSKEWVKIIEKTPLILSQSNDLELISRVCYPTIFYNKGLKNIFVHDRLFETFKEDQSFRAWLEKFGVTDTSKTAYLEKEIIGQYKKPEVDEDHFKVFELIIELHKEGRLEEKHYQQFQKFHFKTNTGYEEARNSYLPQKYNPTIDFSESGIELSFISEIYLDFGQPNVLRNFFKRIFVKDDIIALNLKENKVSIKLLNDETRIDYINKAYLYSQKNLNNKIIPGDSSFFISSFLQIYFSYNSPESSKFFWENFFVKYKNISEAKRQIVGGKFEHKQDLIFYDIGHGDSLQSLDLIQWGSKGENLTYTLSYFFWFVKNYACFPSKFGLRRADEVLINSEENIELGYDCFPVLDLNVKVHKSWQNFIPFRQKLSIGDLLKVLEGEVENRQNSNEINKERLGNVYNTLMEELKASGDSKSGNIIEQWSKNNDLISSKYDCIPTGDLLWIDANEFEDKIDSINIILIPENVDRSHPSFKEMLKYFGVKIISCFTIRSTKEREINDLKLHLLHVLGGLSLVLKKKGKILELETYLRDKFDLIKKTNFHLCKSITRSFLSDGEVIESNPIHVYHDHDNLEFLTSLSWKGMGDFYQLSDKLEHFLSISDISKEFYILCRSKPDEISDFLDSLDISINDLLSLDIYNEIQDYILSQDTTNKLSFSKPVIDESDGNPIIEPINKEETIGDSNNEEIEQDKNRLNEIPYTENELKELKVLFGRELTESELGEENLYAQLKALKYLKDNGFNVLEAEKQFKDNWEKRYLYPVVDAEGNRLKIMCRSARKGVLFLGAYPWKQLEEGDTQLFILTGIQSNDCLWFETNEELEKDLDSDYKILRKHHSNFEEIKTIIDVEDTKGKLANLELLYKVKQSSIDFIFDPQMNEVGDSEGALTDIGADI